MKTYCIYHVGDGYGSVKFNIERLILKLVEEVKLTNLCSTYV